MKLLFQIDGGNVGDFHSIISLNKSRLIDKFGYRLSNHTFD